MYQQWLTQLSNPSFKLSLWHPLLSFKRLQQVFSALLSSHRTFIPVMCWMEHTVRYYECGATTPVQSYAGVEINDISTTKRTKCGHMRTMDRLYDEYVNDFNTNPQNAGRNMRNKQQWAARNGYVLCQKSTYWANWRTTRHCMSNGLHGTSTCVRVGTPHTYWRAWPETLSLDLFFLSRSRFWHLLSVMSLVLCCA